MTTVFNGKPVIWIASYPRSGNTFLRTILWHCFGLRSASLYPGDLGGNRQLEAYVGHIEHHDGQIHFPDGAISLVKTHENDRDDNPAIYVIRDGRAACVSQWRYNNRKDIPVENYLDGENLRFGSWGDHVRSWHPWDRPRTLLLEFEALHNNLSAVLSKLASFLDRNILAQSIPTRDSIAQIDGKYVTKQSDNWRSVLSGPLIERFNELNQDMLERFGYVQRAESGTSVVADQAGNTPETGKI